MYTWTKLACSLCLWYVHFAWAEIWLLRPTQRCEGLRWPGAGSFQAEWTAKEKALKMEMGEEKGEEGRRVAGHGESDAGWNCEGRQVLSQSVKQKFTENHEESGFYSKCNGKLLKAIGKLLKEWNDLIYVKNKKSLLLGRRK